MTASAELHNSRRRAIDEAAQPAGETREDVDKGHGRVERRQATVCRELKWITTAKKWKDLAFAVELVRERTDLSTGETTVEVVHYIAAIPTRAHQRSRI